MQTQAAAGVGMCNRQELRPRSSLCRVRHLDVGGEQITSPSQHPGGLGPCLVANGSPPS